MKDQVLKGEISKVYGLKMIETEDSLIFKAEGAYKKEAKEAFKQLLISIFEQ